MGRVSIIGIRAVSAPLVEDRRVGLVIAWRIAALRRNLAHSQYITACDWDIIVKLTEYPERQLGSGA